MILPKIRQMRLQTAGIIIISIDYEPKEVKNIIFQSICNMNKII